jgi:tagatose 1,6-diphosphate aldolase
MSLSAGKHRGLNQCATASGVFTILALDHRGNLRRILNPNQPESVTHAVMVEFKRQVVAALAPQSSAVLLDPEIGAAPAIVQDALPGTVGLMMAVEATGYTGDPGARASQVLPGWGVDKIRRMGASAVKLLVYYHPESPLAQQQEALVEQVAEDCVRYDIPLFLEPLSYSLDPARKGLPSSELRQVVIETARRLTPLGIDILKAEFPLNVKGEPDESAWLDACRELNAASQTPWTLLSAGVDFDTFLRQVHVALRTGASGVLAGRAVWKEAGDLSGEQRQDFLHTTAAMRMRQLTALCDAFGKPWSQNLPPETSSFENWYQEYSGFR